MELAWMGPAPSYRLLHSLFLPPLPSPSVICLTARRASKCASIRGASGVVELCRQSWSPGYLPSPGRAGISTLQSGSNYVGFGERESDRSGFGVARNSRSDRGVVGSSWTKAGGDSASASSKGVGDSEQTRTSRRSPPSKRAGGITTNRGDDNKEKGPRILKDVEAGGDSPMGNNKRGLGRFKSKFDAPKGTERNGRRSYSSSNQANPSERVQGEDVRKDKKASMVQNGSNQGRPSGDAKGGHQPRGRNKQFVPEQDLRRQLDMCSKHADVKRALELYDKFKVEGKGFFNQYNYNIVLYLCSSAATNSLKPSKSGNERRGAEQENQPRGPLDELSGNVKSRNGAQLATATESGALTDKERIVYMERGFEIYETMKSQGVPPNEATFTAVARLAVAKEDGDLAFDMVKQMAEAKLSPRLRSYAPALYTYCKLKNATKAFEVDEHMKEAGVALEESELEALLKLSVDAGLEDKVYSLLHRLRTTVRDVSQIVVELVQQWFTSSAAASAGKSNWEYLPSLEAVKTATESCGGGWHGLGWLGKGSWEVKSSVVDARGVCQECGEQLVTIDLDPEETEIFAQSLSKLACQREAKNNEFKKFQAWLDRHGPFDAIVDGANVGLYNSNSPGGGGFNFYQLNNVVTGIQKQLGIKKEPLILLHHRRTKGGPAASSFATKVINKWIDGNSIYTTPTGSNDDWYWLYAAVRYRCLLVTNDEMRDHLFSLLGNDFFPKWKERHQVRYTINKQGLGFHMPPPYSTVIQESEKGSWHVPKRGNDDDVLTPREWMCITRTGHAAPGNTKPEELTVSSTSTLESSASGVQEQIAAIDHKGASIFDDEIQPPKQRKSRKLTAESSVSSSLNSSTLSEIKKLEENSRPPKEARSATKKPRFVEPAVESSDVEQPEPQKKRLSASKKSRSTKASTSQPSDVGQLEEQPTPPKRGRAATKKSRSPKSSVLVQKLEEAEKVVENPIQFEI
ncbi:hypothetical protein M758_1G327100 [Ceratodon purpureus]|nr:hypothetical protein M758_1G327100 [Ceratodon purpureus]